MGDSRLPLYSEHFLEAAREQRLTVICLEEASAADIRERIERAFAVPGSLPLWERLTDTQAVYDPEGWKRLVDIFRSSGRLYVFFERRDDRTVLLVNSAQDMHVLLTETPAIEIYVADELLHGLAALNDHDYLIACGAAALRLNELLQRTRGLRG